MGRTVRFGVPLSAWIPQEAKQIKKAFLPFLRHVFLDRTPQYIEQRNEEVTNEWGRTGIVRHQKIHYFVDPSDFPIELTTTYIPDLSLDGTVTLEITFCDSEPGSSFPKDGPYADLIFHQETVDVPERQFNPMDFAVSEQDELSLARPDENDPIGNTLTKIKDEVNPDLGVTDMNKFFTNRFQWLREALISCEHAIEIMLEGIRISLGIKEGRDPPEYWEAMGHTLYTCWEPDCLRFRSDWQTILHMDKYLPWEELYESHKETFHRWGMRK